MLVGSTSECLSPLAIRDRGNLRSSAELLCAAEFQEVRLRKISFPQPVSVFVGLGFPREVGDVLEAYKLLNEWPQSSRGPDHLAALHTCAAVLGGHGTVTDARRAFEDFARSRGVLAPEALQRSADLLGREWLAARAG
jgi:hypothetical protein